MDPDHLNQPLGPGRAGWHAARVADTVALARSWLLSPAFATLITRLEGPAIADLAHDLPALLRWSAAILDTRGGGERHDAPPAAFSTAQIAALLDAADPLGLLHTPPPARPGYDITVILGGTVTGNELRTHLARTLAASGTRLGTLVALTADRPLSPAERPPAGYRTEAEHLAAGLTAAFRPAPPGQPAQGASDVQVVIARPSRPRHRADTSDAIAELSRRIPPSGRRHVLAVTSAIYVPYQYFVIAPALLAAGTRSAEIIGTPTATDGQPARLAQRLAQEIHATITAIGRLLTVDGLSLRPPSPAGSGPAVLYSALAVGIW